MLSLDKAYAQVKSGWLWGERLLNGVKVFRGIPFAAPPIGELRWKPPAPPAEWLGVQKALNFGNEAVQDCDLNNFDMPGDKMEQLLTSAIPISEDCLYLNIWTPAETPNDNLPVFVWVHGGYLQIGAGSSFLYDSAVLAQKKIVVVTINYRLGLFGFLAHPELTRESENNTSGNYALLDQLMAIKWVKENILGFGGDPNNITIGGQSAGSLTVSALIASPLAKGLFHRAVLQSGPPFGLNKFYNSLKGAEEEGQMFMKASAVEKLSELRAIPTWELFEKSKKHAFMPQIVADGWLLPDHPGNIIRAGKHNKVTLLLGSTSGELCAGYSPDIGLLEIEYKNNILSQFSEDASRLLALYPAGNPFSTAQSAIRLGADGFLSGTRMVAKLAKKHGNDAYLYYFTRVLPNVNGDFYGAPHSSELPFLFHLVNKGGILPWDEHIWEEFDYKYSEIIMSYWVNFIKNGDPNGEGLVEWSKYDETDDRLMEFRDAVFLAPTPRPEKLAVLEYVFSKHLSY